MTGGELDALEPRDLEYRYPQLPQGCSSDGLGPYKGLTAVVLCTCARACLMATTTLCMVGSLARRILDSNGLPLGR